MFEVGVVVHFEAAHSLDGEFGPATRKHGHTYRAEIAVRGSTLRDDGTLVDIALLQEQAGAAAAALHLQDLDELEPFAGLNTTAEVVAHHLFERVAPRVHGEGVHAVLVRVWESPTAYAQFEGTLGEL